MPKVLTYHNLTHGEHWFKADPYGKRQIEAISDPEGGETENPPTSIPSPFARIDLVRTAFKNIIKDKQLIGEKIDRKLVSDCLDVAEVFFNIDYLKDKLQIIAWDQKEDLKNLLNSPNQHHRRLGEVLQLYLQQDAHAYNFDKVQRLYIIEYNYKVIGGTSPSTLFFPSANDLSFVDVPLEKNRLFSGEYKPLYERNPDFQLYLYGLLSFFHSAGSIQPDFRFCFKEVADYLDLNLEIIRATQPTLYEQVNQQIKAGEVAFKEKYAELDTGAAGDVVELLGFPLRKRKIEIGSVADLSDFVIDAPRYQQGVKPLVLQNQFNKPYVYVNDVWNKNINVPYKVDAPLDERKLPGQVISYPFLTVSDFLEPYLIRLVYPINQEKFFDGNLAGNKEDKGYILPVKKAYFDFFGVDDLQKNVSDGKPVFEMEARAAGAIRVTLRIPVKKDYITFERIYMPNVSEGDAGEPDEANNKGVIIENQFGITVYPFIKTGNQTENHHYRVALIDRDISAFSKYHQYDLYFFTSDGTKVPQQAMKMRSNKQADDRATSQYYVLDKEFDLIQVKHQLGEGIIIPKFPQYHGGNDTYTFAIDFGTTNTHIEYKVNSGNPRAFDIIEEDVQIATLHDPAFAEVNADFGGSGATLIRDLIPQEFLPRHIGQQYEFRFPQRTVLGENHNLNLDTSTYALSDFNIPFVYEKYLIRSNTRISSDLKWSNYTKNKEDKRRVEAFFENLLLLIRNKVLMNRGNLDKTKLIWFYPSSMLPNRRNSLESTWTQLFHRYITKEKNPQKLSESIAPFYFYKEKLGKSAADKPSVGIDIGGGTTDIVVFQNNQPTLLTSFRFAANAVFGDGFHGSAAINGFIRRYLDDIERTLSENKQYELLQVLNAIREEQRSQDIIAFFFSLEENMKIKEKTIPVSFNNLLTDDDDFKIIFIIFYTAIIYHVAKLMKAEELEMPRNILFSGRGSKVINIADRSARLESLTILTQMIFKDIYGQESQQIELVQYESPKEITCKGGLLSDTDIDIDHIKKILLGTGENIVIPDQPVKYPDLKEETLQKVLDETRNFINLLYKLHYQYNFTHHFGVNPAFMDKYKEYLQQDLMEFLKSGTQLKMNELAGNQDVNIEETLFFYPLTGALNRLAFKIATELNSESVD